MASILVDSVLNEKYSVCISVYRKILCLLKNIFTAASFKKSRFYYDSKKHLYIVREDRNVRYFHERQRGFDFYRNSISKRGNRLFNSYCLNNIEFFNEDVVIDCGANYGDLFINLSEFIREENYIAFEPGPVESKCIGLSIPHARNMNVGLSNASGEMKFYLSSAGGDSSLIKPKTYTQVIDVPVTTLDAYIQENHLKHCKLLKLEAEGAEPEILEGAREFLKICEYVAVDGGPERGVLEQATLPSITNALVHAGYEMVAINGRMYRALFRNTKF